MRWGHLNYVNALPLYEGLEGCELVSGHPAKLNELLYKGELDISLVSSIEYLHHQEHYDLVPGFCIAAKGEVQSVLLYTRLPLPELSGKKLALTSESASSAQLVKILCKHFWQITPEFVPLTNIPEHDAFLLIGDQSLRHPTFPGYESIDLATVWYEKTGLPMTFALFAMRKGLDPTPFQEALEKSLKWSEQHWDKIIEKGKRLINISLADYFPHLRYRLAEEELAGLKTFAALSGYVYR